MTTTKVNTGDTVLVQQYGDRHWCAYRVGKTGKKHWLGGNKTPTTYPTKQAILESIRINEPERTCFEWLGKNIFGDDQYSPI